MDPGQPQPAPAYAEMDGNPQQQPAPQPPLQFVFSEEQLQLLVGGLAAQFANIAAQNAPVPAPAAPPPPPRPRRIRIHEPEVFDGTRARYRSWKNQVQRFLTAFPDSSDHEKITMVISYVRGEQVNTWVDGFTDSCFDPAAAEWGADLAALWRDLDKNFVDFAMEANALRKLQDLRQGEREAAEFIQEFEATRGMTALDVEDPMTLEFFKNAINPRYRTQIALLPVTVRPANFESWKEVVKDVDNSWRLEQSAINANRARAHTSRAHAAPRAHHAPAAQHHTTGNAARADGTGVTYGGRGQPMDVDRARVANTCFRCGRSRYNANGCANPWHRNPTNRAEGPAQGGQRLRQQDTHEAEQPPAQPEAQVPGLTRDQLVAEMRRFAQEDPAAFAQAGFGNGPA